MSEQKTPARGLGRGLSALMGDTPVVQSSAEDVSRETNIDLIHPNASQPRKHFDKEELISLAETIKEHGIVQPIVVRKDADRSGHYSIIAGERRWRAAQIAGLHKVPIVIKDYDDLKTLKIAIIENLQRANLNPIEEALAYTQLSDRFNYNQQTIADSVGKSRPYIANTMRLLSLDADIQEYLINGQLSAGHARAILASDNPRQLAEEIIAKGLNVRDAEKRVNAKPKAKNVSRETFEDADTKALTEDLSSSLGLDVQIKHNPNNKGQVTISYNSLEQLDALCRKLTN